MKMLFLLFFDSTRKEILRAFDIFLRYCVHKTTTTSVRVVLVVLLRIESDGLTELEIDR